MQNTEKWKEKILISLPVDSLTTVQLEQYFFVCIMLRLLLMVDTIICITFLSFAAVCTG